MKLDDLVYEIHSHPYFPALKKAVLDRRPLITNYDVADDEKSVREWKRSSSLQEGFDLCMELLKIKPE